MSHKHLREQARQGHDARVSAIVRAHGGRTDEASDKKMVEHGVHEHESNMHEGKTPTKLHLKDGGFAEGEKSGGRMDRARGGRGRAGHGSHVNVIVAPGRGAPTPVPVPAAGLAGPRPPMPPPGGGPPVLPGGGMGPSMPGGGGMPMAHPVNPAMMGGMRPPMVAAGGRIALPVKAGSHSALGRLAKAKMQIPSARMAGD